MKGLIRWRTHSRRIVVDIGNVKAWRSPECQLGILQKARRERLTENEEENNVFVVLYRVER